MRFSLESSDAGAAIYTNTLPSVAPATAELPASTSSGILALTGLPSQRLAYSTAAGFHWVFSYV